MGAKIRFRLFFFVLRFLLTIYDLLTLPLYLLLQKPWRKWASKPPLHTEPSPPTSTNPYASFGRTDSRFTSHYGFTAQTIPQLIDLSAVHNDPSAPSLGYRQVLLGSGNAADVNKKIVPLALTEYRWLTLAETHSAVQQLAKAFLSQGVAFQERILIYAETRHEWLLCAQALLRIGSTVTTLFSTLGTAELVYGITETEVSHVVTSRDLLPGLLTLIGQLPSIRYIYVLEERKAIQERVGQAEFDQVLGDGRKVQLIDYQDLLSLGANVDDSELETRKPGPDDVAVVLYTSGSTGQPKGVLQTHRNFLTVVQALYSLFDDKIMNHPSEHVYYAFLPLAHTFELIAEMVFFGGGIAIGYGSATTMVDEAPGLKKAVPGDLKLLRPTVMCSVPLVLDRIRKKLEDRFASSAFETQLFDFILSYKTFWKQFAMDTPILNHLVCQKAAAAVGGRVQFMIVGGAPLSVETQKLIENFLNIRVLVGYGMTETCAACFVSNFTDPTLGTTSLLHGVEYRLIDWLEGGYTVRGQANPRGELVVGGPSVSVGYFQRPALTEESFETDPTDGTRWFKSGDIAERVPDGSIKIIDRKKDLLKLQNGEYVSIGKIEAELKCFPLLEHVAVYGSLLHNDLIALISPNEPALRKLAADTRRLELLSSKLEVLSKDTKLTEAVHKELVGFCAKVALSKMETPARVQLCSEEWTVGNGLLTATMKINRGNIRAFYGEDIKRLFSSESYAF